MASRKRKRANNEGSIFQRPNGSWRAQVTIDGKRLNFSAKTQGQCRDWVRFIQNQIADGVTHDGINRTLAKYMDQWLGSIEATVRQTTYVQYSQIDRDYIRPALGSMRMKEIGPENVQSFYNKCKLKGVSDSTVRMIHIVLHRSLAQAVQYGLLMKNPATGVNLPKKEWKEMKFYHEGEVQRLLESAKENEPRYLALFKLAVTTGMRQGELLALKWDDLDWKRKTLHVRRQLKRKKGGGFRFAAPKTKAGMRKIALGSDTIQYLKIHKQQLAIQKSKMGSTWKENGMMFPSTVGTPTQPDKIIKRFKNAASKAGLPTIRFHDLRHTAASLMLNNNIPVLVVSRRLGHSKPSVTLDVYGHLISNMQEDVANLMDEITSIQTKN